jgi:hypothetical protein
MNTQETSTPDSLGAATGSALTDDARLAEIRAEALSETYGGNLDFGHVGLGDFLEWVRLMQPRYARIKGYEDLTNFDVNSILGLFEEWTQGKHDAELNIRTTNKM